MAVSRGALLRGLPEASSGNETAINNPLAPIPTVILPAVIPPIAGRGAVAPDPSLFENQPRILHAFSPLSADGRHALLIGSEGAVAVETVGAGFCTTRIVASRDGRRAQRNENSRYRNY
jgi:hypothetical protein